MPEHGLPLTHNPPPPRQLSRSPFAAHASRLAEGFTLIAASPYLLAACAFLALNYSVSATLYFVRAAVVSRDGALADSGARIAFFAALNTASAGLIFTAQLLVTGEQEVTQGGLKGVERAEKAGRCHTVRGCGT